MRSNATTASSPITLGWVMWALVSLFYGYQFFIRVSPSVMSDELMSAFGVTAGALGVLSSVYYLVYSPLQLPLGIMIDRFGPRRLASLSILLCGMGCLLFASAGSLTAAKLGRMLMGAGSACAFMSCLKIAAMWLPANRFTTAAGFTMMIGTLGAMTASRPLAEMIGSFGWRSTLSGLAVVGIGLAAAVFFVTRDKVVAPDRTPQSAGILSGVKAIVKNPQSWLIALYTFLMYSPMVIFGDIWGVPYFMQKFCVNCIDAAGPASMLYFGIAFGAPTFAWMSDWLKCRKVPMFLTTTLTFSIFVFLLYGPHLTLMQTTILIFMAGFCLGGQFLGFPVICEISPPHLSGTAVGFNNTICMISGVLFQPCVGYILDHFWTGAIDTAGLPLYSVFSYTCGMSIIPLCAFAATILLFFIKETHPSRVR